MAMVRSTLICGFFCALVSISVPAVTVYECVDAGGNSSFRDQCPPGMILKSEREVTGDHFDDGPTVEEIAEQRPVTLFSVPDCDACDLVRYQLDNRNIPYTEKDVADNPDSQAELKEASGSVTVPTVMVGTEIFSGYSRSALDMGLTQAGYPTEHPTN